MLISRIIFYLTKNKSLLKRLICFGCLDSLSIVFAILLSLWLQSSQIISYDKSELYFFILFQLFIGIVFYIFTGQYKALSKYVGSQSLYSLIVRNGLLTIIFYFFSTAIKFNPLESKYWILLWLSLIFFTGSYRLLLRDVLIKYRVKTENIKKTRVAIYGVGETGADLALSLKKSANYSLKYIFDDDPNLWGRTLNSISIVPPQKIKDLSPEIDRVFLAIKAINRKRRRQIVDQFQSYNIQVFTVPSVDDLTSGKARIDDIAPIRIEDLLGRNSVPPDPLLLGPGISGSSVCVTGAGGSIGSELIRQIIKFKPSTLILLDRSEPSLYKIEQEIIRDLPEEVKLKVVLGSANNLLRIEKLFIKEKTQVVFHAAAYKHVPLVEANPLQGIVNNALTTRNLCEASLRAGVKKFCLISTDKAVRPTNVMGASKRLAELVVQAFHMKASYEKNEKDGSFTCFSMVRFGNVLGSSGSVVPLFRQQIASGGPITITHPKIIRYFMTVYEAAQLVLQSSMLSEGGEVFLLDMGDPVLINNLAKEMIRLSGLTLKDRFNPEGDIEIIYTGLRLGEKLFEELLIDGESIPTKHPLIFKAIESSINPDYLWREIDKLEKSIKISDEQTSLKILSQLIPEWKRGK